MRAAKVEPPNLAASGREHQCGSAGGHLAGTPDSGTHHTLPSVVAVAVTAPIAITGAAVHASKKAPYYIALGGLAAVGAVDWPVAVAIGGTYWLLRRPR